MKNRNTAKPLVELRIIGFGNSQQDAYWMHDIRLARRVFVATVRLHCQLDRLL